MTMYDELVRDLWNWSKAWGEEPNPVGPVPVKRLAEAADAIEELNHRIESLESEREISSEAEYAIDKYADNLISHMEELIKGLESKSRWVSVTERLPKKNQIVVAHEGKGTWDFGMFRGISSSGNQEYWHWKGNTLKHVKWWMPKDDALPEPPKEEV